MYYVCYILVDHNNEKFFNELMISVSSLRHVGYEGRILAAADRKTVEVFPRGEAQRLGIELKEIPVSEVFSPMQASRYIKTNLRNLIDGDYLFVDTDTIFAENLPAFISSAELALVPEFNSGRVTEIPGYYTRLTGSFTRMGLTIPDDRLYYNSGVMWVRDTAKAHAFYSEWNKMWAEYNEKGISTDQQTLNYVNWMANDTYIDRLDDIYNYQVCAYDVIDFSLLSRSVLIHYMHLDRFHSYLMAQGSRRYTDDEIASIIRSPRFAFTNGILLTAEDQSLDFFMTSTGHFFWKLYANHKKAFRIPEGLISFMLKLKQSAFKRSGRG